MSGCYSLLLLDIPHIIMKTIEIESSTYELLQEIKKIFVGYTGEALEDITDDRVIEVLASGFVESTDEEDWEDHQHSDHHDHDHKKGCHHEGWEGCRCSNHKK